MTRVHKELILQGFQGLGSFCEELWFVTRLTFVKCSGALWHEMTGWDMARRHRENACGKEHGQCSAAEGLNQKH